MPLSAPELAKVAGVSPNTVRKWAAIEHHPLQESGNAGRYPTYTVTQLRAFCAAHPDLYATGRVVQRLDSAVNRGVEDQQPQQTRTALLNLRVAAQAALDAATSAVQQAEQNAVAHREQIDALALMIRSYDDLLTQLTAPSTLRE